MPLDPEVKQLLERLHAADPRPRSVLSVAETREKYLQSRTLAGRPRQLARVEDRTIPGRGRPIPVRIYAPTSGTVLPALVYFHGGRFISGDLETHDPVCRDLATRSGCIIVAVDYRLAPEHRFPAALDDAYDAVVWVSENGYHLGIEAQRVGVGGDSVGANLAAVVALLDRDRRGGALKCQMLVYPMLDATCSCESHRTFATGYGPGSEDMMRGWREYLGGQVDPKNPLASPFFAKDLRGLPPALVQTAEYDTLRDEAETYARRLRDAGVPVVSTRYDGAIHGFFQMAGVLESGRRAMDEAAGFLRDVLGSSPGAK
jgi:acetyl esterase